MYRSGNRKVIAGVCAGLADRFDLNLTGVRWAKIREARRNDEGTYLLRTNLTDCDPKTLWKKYMIQGEIEYAFREMKHDLGLRPVYHQLDDRIEAHIFTSFMAFCLLTTLRAMAREHAPGLTPRQIVANLKTIKMVDVVMPTTDGRVVTLPRYVEPKELRGSKVSSVCEQSPR